MGIFLRIYVGFFMILLVSWSYADAASRTITVTNNCPIALWPGVHGGSAINNSNAGTVCASNNDCPSGAQCISTGGGMQCFWDSPMPNPPQSSQYKLEPNNSFTFTINVPDGDVDIFWSGGIAGRTDCNGGGCATADCGSNEGACKPGVGFSTPSNVAEFTFSKGRADYYDLTIINGINVPLSITTDQPTATNNPYLCGTPGNSENHGTGSNVLAGCSWDFVPPAPSSAYRRVTTGGATCTTDSDCSDAGTVCGLTDTSISGNTPGLSCGKFLGYWTGDEVCARNQSYSQPPYNCATAAGTGTVGNLYACSGPYSASCYSNDAQPSSCCGCVNWQDAIPGMVPTDPTVVMQCVAQNPDWVSKVQPNLVWLKNACPSAYVFPYDDKSSTFSCANVQDGVNQVNYTVTFCPSGKMLMPNSQTTEIKKIEKKVLNDIEAPFTAPQSKDKPQ